MAYETRIRLHHDESQGWSVVYRRHVEFGKKGLRNKSHAVKGFTKRYNLDKLVYYEVFDDISEAIRREKILKKYLRYEKITLIKKINPAWSDLSETIFA